MYLHEVEGFDKLNKKDTECRTRLDRENVQEWLKTICGFSNSCGGNIIIGVEPGSKLLHGFTQMEADDEICFLNQQIEKHINSKIKYNISLVQYEDNEKTLFVICVDIQEFKYKPVSLNMGLVSSIFIRKDGFTYTAAYDDIVRMMRRI